MRLLGGGVILTRCWPYVILLPLLLLDCQLSSGSHRWRKNPLVSEIWYIILDDIVAQHTKTIRIHSRRTLWTLNIYTHSSSFISVTVGIKTSNSILFSTIVILLNDFPVIRKQIILSWSNIWNVWCCIIAAFAAINQWNRHINALIFIDFNSHFKIDFRLETSSSSVRHTQTKSLFLNF